MLDENGFDLDDIDDLDDDEEYDFFGGTLFDEYEDDEEFPFPCGSLDDGEFDILPQDDNLPW